MRYLDGARFVAPRSRHTVLGAELVKTLPRAAFFAGAGALAVLGFVAGWVSYKTHHEADVHRRFGALAHSGENF